MAIPKSPHSVAYEAILKVLESDPVLKANRIAIVARDGGKTCWPPAKGGVPAVFVQIDSTPWGWETEGEHDAPLTISLTLAVAQGQGDSAILDLWGAILAAIFPSITREADHARVQGILGPTAISQITAIQAPGCREQGDVLLGEGKLAVQIYLSTGE